MPVFVDTSAILAFLSPTDALHERARSGFEHLRAQGASLVTTSYVLVETYALVDRRFGRGATSRFREGFAPLLEVIWVDAEMHDQGLDLLAASPASTSLVDAVSFVCCRTRRIDTAWALDRHFEENGFGAPL